MPRSVAAPRSSTTEGDAAGFGVRIVQLHMSGQTLQTRKRASRTTGHSDRLLSLRPVFARPCCGIRHDGRSLLRDSGAKGLPTGCSHADQPCRLGTGIRPGSVARASATCPRSAAWRWVLFGLRHGTCSLSGVMLNRHYSLTLETGGGAVPSQLICRRGMSFFGLGALHRLRRATGCPEDQPLNADVIALRKPSGRCLGGTADQREPHPNTCSTA